jgi:hypothetical protein
MRLTVDGSALGLRLAQRILLARCGCVRKVHQYESFHSMFFSPKSRVEEFGRYAPHHRYIYCPQPRS